MPIRPEERARYPKDWPAISRRVRDRAGNICEGSPAYPDCRAVNGEAHPVTGSKVVLTVAHLNHTPEDVADDNLKAWCQRCHLTYDAPHHAKNAAATRRARMNTAELFEGDGEADKSRADPLPITPPTVSTKREVAQP